MNENTFTGEAKMPHKPYELINGVRLPGEMAVVTSRVFNWLKYGKEEKLEPVSCWVLAPKESNHIQPQAPAIIADLLLNLGMKLQENAGVDIVLDEIPELLRQFPKNKNRIDITGETPKAHFDNLEIIKVADSMRLSSEESRQKFQGCVSIIDSWKICIESLYKEGTNILFDLSLIREKDNISSGKQSFIQLLQSIVNLVESPSLINFLHICSEMCSVIKRGGFRRNGAVTSSLKYENSEIINYLNIPFGEITHLKKSVQWDFQQPFKKSLSPKVIKLFVEKYNKGEVFAEKYLGHSKGQELRSNVCRGIGLIPGDKCLISNVNLGMISCQSDLPKIEQGYKEVAEFLCEIFALQEKQNYQFIDRQIAICPVGLANCLRNLKISYKTFIEELTFFNDYRTDFQADNLAGELVFHIYKGMLAAAQIATSHKMRACLSVEPNESCSRRYKDALGYDLAPNIVAPDVIPGIGVEKRHSEIGIYDFDGSSIASIFNYGTDIETASQLSPQWQYHLNNEFQKLMDSVGMAHMISYEHWGEMTVPEFMHWLNNSHLKSLYYKRDIGVKHLEKGLAISQRSSKVDLTALRQASSQLQNTIDDLKNSRCTPEYCDSCGD